jgi:hypothetical protein
MDTEAKTTYAYRVTGVESIIVQETNEKQISVAFSILANDVVVKELAQGFPVGSTDTEIKAALQATVDAYATTAVIVERNQITADEDQAVDELKTSLIEPDINNEIQ